MEQRLTHNLVTAIKLISVTDVQMGNNLSYANTNGEH